MTSFARIHGLLTPRERKSALALIVLMIVGMSLDTLGVGLVIPAMALLMQSDIAAGYPWAAPLLVRLGNPTQAQLVAGGMVALVLVFLVKSVFLAMMTWRQTRFAYRLQAQISERLFATYLRQPYTFMLQRNSAELVRNAITEVHHFTANAVLPAMLVLTEGLVLVGIAALLLLIEPLGAIVVVTVMALAAWTLHRFTRARISRWGVERQHHEGLRIQHLNQGLGAAKDVKLLGRERDFLAQYHTHNAQTAHVEALQITILQLPRLWLELLAVIGLATLVFTMMAQGRELSRLAPALGLFAAAAFRLMPSINRVLGAVQSLRYGLPVLDLLCRELALAGPESTDAAPPRAPFRRDIRVDRVTYTYPGATTPALLDLTLMIRRGESVGLIGPSGSGKSTLVDVILGLLAPGAGCVLVDGEDIRANLRGWQQQIGYVPQSIYLTDDTLRRNVAFGLADAEIDDAAVRRAVAAAQLDEFVASVPDGMNVIVGERGIRLSGGQRQRIGIARALYHDPAVLVLDEATSALDTATERGVMEAVAALHGTKTIVIVAHRLSTVEQCDRLYRLEQGRVAGEGRPADLLGALPAV